jgi:hypothetical protein
MAIFVNIPRSTNDQSTPAELELATLGDWPLRGRGQIVDVVAEIGDAIYGVRGNTIVSAYPITAITVTEKHRFRVTASDNHAAVGNLIGTTLPDELAWKPAEQWPVKLHDTDFAG